MMHFRTWFSIMMLVVEWAGPLSRYSEFSRISHTIVRATPDSFERGLLTAVGRFEGGFTINKVGTRGEIGTWQLMPLKGHHVPRDLDGQAQEALHRMHVSIALCGDLTAYTSGRCGYGQRESQDRLKLAWQYTERLMREAP
jgi:hypothetical protein